MPAVPTTRGSPAAAPPPHASRPGDGPSSFTGRSSCERVAIEFTRRLTIRARRSRLQPRSRGVGRGRCRHVLVAPADLAVEALLRVVATRPRASSLRDVGHRPPERQDIRAASAQRRGHAVKRPSSCCSTTRACWAKVHSTSADRRCWKMVRTGSSPRRPSAALRHPGLVSKRVPHATCLRQRCHEATAEDGCDRRHLRPWCRLEVTMLHAGDARAPPARGGGYESRRPRKPRSCRRRDALTSCGCRRR